MVFIFWQFKHFNIRPSELSNFDCARERERFTYSWAIGGFLVCLKVSWSPKGFLHVGEWSVLRSVILKTDELAAIYWVRTNSCQVSGPETSYNFCFAFPPYISFKKMRLLDQKCKSLKFYGTGTFFVVAMKCHN